MHRPGRIRSDRWYQIATLCRERPRTVPAIATEMGVAQGSIQSLIRSMRQEKLLEEAESDARGVALKLSARGTAELRKAEADAAADIAALLPSGERLVFVTDDGRGIAAEALAELASDPCFRWAARVDGPVKWIASFGSGDATAADRAVNALANVGARAVVGRADTVFGPTEMADYVARLDKNARAALEQG